MKKLWLTVFLSAAMLPCIVAGQCRSSQDKPGWLDEGLKDLSNSYIETATATGPSEDEARNKAAQMIVERRSSATGIRAKVMVQNGAFKVAGSDELTVKARVLDEYREWCGPGEYRVTLLVQTAKNPTLDFDNLIVTDKYDFSPRVFVPGMAQLQKGSKLKGVLFIAGEAVLIGGVVAAESLRASYTSKINGTHNAVEKQSYIDDADSWGNIRNGLIAGAAALYVWNVIDGIAAKGSKHYRLLSANNVRIAPFATPNMGGFAMAIKF